MNDIHTVKTAATKKDAKSGSSTPTDHNRRSRTWGDILSDARTARDNWQVHEEKTNHSLYEILADCFEAYQALVLDKEARSHFFKSYKSEDLTENKRTPLESKVIRYVFKISRRKLSAYARVLRVANAAGIKRSALPSWITEQGGIEQIRRSKPNQSGALSRAAAIAKAEELLSTLNSLAEIDQAPDDLKPIKGEKFSIVIVRRGKGSNASIVHAVESKSAIKATLAAVGQSLYSKAKQEEAEKAERSRSSARRQAIEAAAA